jgi:hypothetical protein
VSESTGGIGVAIEEAEMEERTQCREKRERRSAIKLGRYKEQRREKARRRRSQTGEESEVEGERWGEKPSVRGRE